MAQFPQPHLYGERPQAYDSRPQLFGQQSYSTNGSFPAPSLSYQDPFVPAHPFYDYANQSEQRLPGASSYTNEKQHPGGGTESTDRLALASDLRDGTLAGEYAAAKREGFKPSQQDRGSLAALMAANGAIPEKAGLKMWRSGEHSGEFFRGGKRNCCGRCCCCMIIVILLIIIGLVSAFLLWVRPPNVTFNGVEAPADGSPEVGLVNSGFQISFNLNIGVTNPNFFGASFSKIEAQAFYPGHQQVALGGGEMTGVNIKPHSNTTIHFPFKVNYTTQADPDRSILADVATKCGFLGQNASKITVDYRLILHVKVVLFNISPSFSSSTSFDCPLSQADIGSVLGSGSLATLGGLSGSKRSLSDSMSHSDDYQKRVRRRRQLDHNRISKAEKKRAWLGGNFRYGLSLSNLHETIFRFKRHLMTPRKSPLVGIRKGFGLSSSTSSSSSSRHRH